MRLDANLTTFTTPRLLAERLITAHLAELRLMHADPVGMASIGGIRDEATTPHYLTTNLIHWEDHGFGIWALRMRQSGAFVGRAGLRRTELNDWQEVELAYALLPTVWGCGLATEVGMALQEIAAARLGLRGLIAWTQQSNRESQRVLQKLTFHTVDSVIHRATARLLYRWHVNSFQAMVEP